jgi:hypothetical protein
LRAAKAADADALARLAAVRRDTVVAAASQPAVKLADAQFTIARELRFPSWAKLKAHIESLDRQRAAIDQNHPAPDGDLKTVHIRCGSDIRQTLVDAGFVGDFLEHAIPYGLGPVTSTPDRHELMGRFIVDTFGELKGGLTYEGEIEGLTRGETRLRATAEDYDRVVLWMSHGNWDQLALARVLSLYANAKRPRVLELIAVDEFPGSERFIGIGVLPAEALRLLWNTRKPVTPAQLALGNDVWNALASSNPQQLAVLARTGTPALPLMAPVLHRHLCELPSVENGLSLTQQLVLQFLSEDDTLTLNRVFLELLRGREPLFFRGDWGLLRLVDAMLEAFEPVFTRVLAAPGERYFLQKLTITDVGRAVLRGERDWMSLRPPPRWVGGVHVQPGVAGWRWDEATCEAVFRD